MIIIIKTLATMVLLRGFYMMYTQAHTHKEVGWRRRRKIFFDGHDDLGWSVASKWLAIAIAIAMFVASFEQTV